jgi:hypothetical protein
MVTATISSGVLKLELSPFHKPAITWHDGALYIVMNSRDQLDCYGSENSRRKKMPWPEPTASQKLPTDLCTSRSDRSIFRGAANGWMTISDAQVCGIDLDAKTRCPHYHSVRDIIAIQMKCLRCLLRLQGVPRSSS